MTTSDQSALLAAILADPTQDTPRLAYADWCEEPWQPPESHARGEFIRVQVELAWIGPKPTGNCRCDGGGTVCGACLDERDWERETAALRARERELWNYGRIFQGLSLTRCDSAGDHHLHLHRGTNALRMLFDPFNPSRPRARYPGPRGSPCSSR